MGETGVVDVHQVPVLGGVESVGRFPPTTASFAKHREKGKIVGQDRPESHNRGQKAEEKHPNTLVLRSNGSLQQAVRARNGGETICTSTEPDSTLANRRQLAGTLAYAIFTMISRVGSSHPQNVQPRASQSAPISKGQNPNGQVGLAMFAAVSFPRS